MIIFLSLSLGSYSQNKDEVVSIQKQVNEDDNSMQLKFENKKNIDSSKLPLFIERLENYYQEIENIEYLSDNNSFIIYFREINVEQHKVTDILTHFDIYNFDYK